MGSHCSAGGHLTDTQRRNALAAALRNHKAKSNFEGSEGVQDKPGIEAVDVGVRALIRLHGKSAVKESIKRMSKQKRGRKVNDDWLKLYSVTHDDAIRWLDDPDAKSYPTNNKVANDFVTQNPEDNPENTKRRIMDKLSKERRTRMLFAASETAKSGYPHAKYLFAITSLAEFETVFSMAALMQLQNYQTYVERFGQPDEQMTMDEMEREVHKSLSQSYPVPRDLTAESVVGGLLSFGAERSPVIELPGDSEK